METKSHCKVTREQNWFLATAYPEINFGDMLHWSTGKGAASDVIFMCGRETPPVMISVVIPAFNERSRILPTLQRLQHYFSPQPYLYEILVVDDGSTDGSQELIRQTMPGNDSIILLENTSNRGKGFSVRRGMLRASGDLILFSDADLSTPIEELDKFFPFFERGYAIVIGSRGLPASDIRERQPFYRQKMGQTFNLLVRLLAVRGIKDTQCGFKCFTKAAAKEVFRFQKIDRFGFDPEVLFIANSLGYKIKEVPITWENSPHSKVHPFWDSMSMFKDLLRIRWLHRHSPFPKRPPSY